LDTTDDLAEFASMRKVKENEEEINQPDLRILVTRSRNKVRSEWNVLKVRR